MEKEIIIERKLEIGRGYFLRWSHAFVPSEYCYTLWGAKWMAKRMLKRAEGNDGEICKIKLNSYKI